MLLSGARRRRGRSAGHLLEAEAHGGGRMVMMMVDGHRMMMDRVMIAAGRVGSGSGRRGTLVGQHALDILPHLVMRTLIISIVRQRRRAHFTRREARAIV